MLGSRLYGSKGRQGKAWNKRPLGLSRPLFVLMPPLLQEEGIWWELRTAVMNPPLSGRAVLEQTLNGPVSEPAVREYS